MPAIIALGVAFIVGLILPLRGIRAAVAWLWSSLVMPAFVLLFEFVLPYSGGGASFWPIALIVGAVLGIMSGGLGVAAAVYYADWRSKRNNQPGKEA